MKLQNWFKTGLLIPVILLAAYTVKTPKPGAAKAAGKYAALLSLYQPVAIDNFKVFSTAALSDAKYKFFGKKLDNAMIQLLPKKMISDEEGAGYFATYKFDIDANRTGLLTRSPGQYDSSSIKLLIYDKQKDAITEYFEVAELWGDAGDKFEEASWFYKNADKTINCLLWQEATHDGKLDDEQDTTKKITDHYYQIGFKKSVHDTLDRNAKALYMKFKGMK